MREIGFCVAGEGENDGGRKSEVDCRSGSVLFGVVHDVVHDEEMVVEDVDSSFGVAVLENDKRKKRTREGKRDEG